MLPDPESTSRTQGIQVIARAAAILRIVCAAPDGMSLGQIAAASGLARSTVQRIVEALEQEYLVQAGQGGVRPGWGLRRLGDLPGPGVAAELRAPLFQLFKTTHETVDLSTLAGTEVLFLDRFLSDQRLRAIPAIGVQYPAYTMAIGKALLSLLPNKEIESLYGKGALERLTPRSLRSVPELLKDVERIRAGGFAYDQEEHAMGACAVGLPILHAGEQLFGVSVVMPTDRFESNRERVEAALRRCADECAHRLASNAAR